MSRILKAIERKKTQNPQMEYSWAAELPILMSPNGQGLLIGQNDVDDLSTRITSFEVPNIQFETKKNTIGSSFFYTASNHDVGNVNIRIDEMEDGLTMAYFDMWRSCIINENGLYYPPTAYKKTLRHIKLSSTGDDIHFTKMINYFPTSISPVSYTYAGNAVTEYNVSFTGDNVEHYIVPAGEIRTLVANAQNAFIGRGSPGFGRMNFGGGINNEIADIAFKMGSALKGFL